VDSTLTHQLENLDRFLSYDDCEHPIVVQLGGSEPDNLERAASLVAKYGYDEINLNCGCPSERVAGKGCFGASLMLDPQLVGRCVAAIRKGSGDKVPVTIKCRIGVDNSDSYEELHRFIDTVSKEGCEHFIIHARKAWLKGLSPKENRTVPPLKYDVVYRLTEDFRHLKFTLNGGIHTLDEVEDHLRHGVYGVMMGRAASDHAWTFADVDRRIYGVENPPLTRRQVLLEYGAWAAEKLRNTRESKHTILKPVMSLFVGERGARLFRRAITEGIMQGLDVDQVIHKAMECVPDEVLDAPRPDGQTVQVADESNREALQIENLALTGS